MPDVSYNTAHIFVLMIKVRIQPRKSKKIYQTSSRKEFGFV